MIQLTEKAARNFKRIREDEELEDSVPLRVAVKGGGCAGYEYVFTFDNPNKRDLTFESKGVNIVVDKKSHIVIDGLEIEWSTDLSAQGQDFKIQEQLQRVVVLLVFQLNLQRLIVNQLGCNNGIFR